MTGTDPAVGGNRVAITACVILATLMHTLDSTIANIALPYMQGSMSASQDEIGWVLTSYIVAAAIMTPPTGFLAGRLGIKRFFLICVVGFTIASMLCGMAQSLTQIVLFRVLQGAFGAAFVPLSQSVMIDISPKDRPGPAMALWSVAVMAGPALGPAIGGWLTESYSWRFVFYINLPVGVLAFVGFSTFMRDSPRKPGERLDWFGFGALGIAVGAFQLLLDRGAELDWFGSTEICIETIVAGGAFYLFLAHTFTTKNPFVRPALFRNRNFLAGVLFIVIVGLTYYASMALQPPYLQTLMGYPVATAGLVMGPRGVATMVAMLLVGRLVGRVDIRVLLTIGLGLTAWAFRAMTGWTPDVGQATIIGVGIVQGMGLAFLTVPLNVVSLSTLKPEWRTEGSGLYSLFRNIGSSAGISIVNSMLTANIQVNHAGIAPSVRATNRMLENPIVTRMWNPLTAAGRAALDAMVTRQAQIIAYIDNYQFLMIATLAAIPLLIVFSRPSRNPPQDHAIALE